jgi:primosomal protein N''
MHLWTVRHPEGTGRGDDVIQTKPCPKCGESLPQKPKPPPTYEELEREVARLQGVCIEQAKDAAEEKMRLGKEVARLQAELATVRGQCKKMVSGFGRLENDRT